VTGLGVISPVGNDVQSFWNALCAGVSGIGKVQQFDVSAYPTQIAGEVKGFDPAKYVEAKEAKRMDKVILYALGAAHEAMTSSGIDLERTDPTRFGTIIGSGIGGLRFLEDEHTKQVQRGPSRVSPFMIPMMIPDMSAGRVSISYGLKGPNYAVVSACASGTHAIGDAWMMIKAGMMDVALCGGSESPVTPLSFAGFCNMKALSTRNDIGGRASCPFDRKRDGFVMGEGAGIIILESLEHAQKRGATILAELTGYGATGDAYHLSAPDPEGDGARRAMEMAIRSAGLTAADIDYINAHGTSTQLNDKLESMAIQKLFGDAVSRVSISSTKSMTGHLLGASGAVEFIASVMALRDGVAPPTINYEDPDPECPLNYTPNTAVKKQIRHVLSNSFGFGGHNASLLVSRYEPSEKNG